MGAKNTQSPWPLLGLLTALSMLASGCRDMAPQLSPESPESSPAASAAVPASLPAPIGDAPRLLDQGWSEQQRQQFYFLSQGSRLIPYAWFMALEEESSQGLFSSTAALTELGYLAQPVQSAQPNQATLNPDGLPIGFARDDSGNGQPWLGLSCAACHTLQLSYAGQTLRIDGGSAMVDHQGLMQRLQAAVQATLNQPAKQRRFAERVLGDDWSSAAQQQLVDELADYAPGLSLLVEQNASDLAYGFGRLDALGAIFNRVCETGLGIRSNRTPANAPVSYPYLWGAPQLQWLQWNNSASSAIARNFGQALGVFADLQLTGTPASGQFSSSVNLANLKQLEAHVEQLRAPAWPDDLFGPLDADKVAIGRQLYARNCRDCHVVRDDEGKFPRTEPNECGRSFVITESKKLYKLQTDAQMVSNFDRNWVDPGALRPYLPVELRDQETVWAPIVLAVAISGTIDRKLAEQGLSGEALDVEALRLGGYRTRAQRRPSRSLTSTYKARPLSGIWATAPFLHNGSVPSLYQMLLPPEQRATSFYVGSGEFDPVEVGVSGDSGFLFDTRLRGNHNSGHSGHEHTQTQGEDGVWRDYTDEQRWALVEYLKSLH